MNFKAQVERDLTAVFHNAREHADVMEFWIDGVRYKGPVIIDDGGAQDRKKPSMRPTRNMRTSWFKSSKHTP